MNLPRVSVVMPVWNAERYLRASLRSLAAQSFSEYELIIIDDGSTDETSAILHGAAQSDPRIRVIRNRTRVGMGHVFNQGLYAAEGEYIARMDGDDVAHHERLARQVAFLDAHPSVVVVGAQLEIIDAQGRVVAERSYPTDDESLRQMMKHVSPFAHPVTMFRRRVAIRVGGYDARYAPAEDLHLWVRLSSCGQLANLPSVLLRYRVHGGSVTATQGMQMQWQSLRVRLLAWRKFGLPMKPVDLLLAFAQLGVAPLPYHLRMALYRRFRKEAVQVAQVSTQSSGW